jgi:hypothetical protein
METPEMILVAGGTAEEPRIVLMPLVHDTVDEWDMTSLNMTCCFIPAQQSEQEGMLLDKS